MDTCNNRIPVVGFSLLEIFLFGGIQYGWFAFVFILKHEGVFNSLCVVEDNVKSNISSGNATSDNLDCFPQDERFNLQFSIGVGTFTVATFIAGQLLLSFNTKVIRVLHMAMAVVGILCFAFTAPGTWTPWLPLPGILLVGVAGKALYISNLMQVLPLLRTKSSLYVGLINGCVDSSVLTMMTVKRLHEEGINKKFSLIGTSILYVLVVGTCTLLHPTSQRSDVPDSNQSTGGNNEPVENEKDQSRKGINREMELSSGNGDRTSGEMKNMTIGGIIRHHLFISHVLWLSIVLLKFYYFLGSANRFMVQVLHDDGRVSYFTDVMTFTMLGCLVSSFIVGYTMDAMEKAFQGIMRTVVPLAVTSCLTILLSALAFVATPTALYVDFIVLTFLRSFVFSINAQYVRIVFPVKYISMVYGMAYSMSGILSMIQYGLFAWTEEYDGAMTHVNVFLLCASIISPFHPALVTYSYRRNKNIYNIEGRVK